MRPINDKELIEVAGGFFQFLTLILPVIAIFCAPKHVHDATNVYNNWGHQIGEAAWEHYHPYDPNK